MRTLLVNANPLDPVSSRLRGLLRVLIDGQAPESATPDTAWSSFLLNKPDLAIIVLSPEPEQGLTLLRRMRAGFSGCLLAVGRADDSKMILRALHEGADHYLDEAELETGLEAALARLQNKLASANPAGQVLALLSASGGCGASTLAVNLATVLAKDSQRCCLMDLKPGRGDLASLLDLKPAFNLADLCLNVARLDWAIFEKVLVRSPPRRPAAGGAPDLRRDAHCHGARSQSVAEQVTHFVPDEPKTINLSNNAGVPAVVKYPTAKVSQSIVKLSQTIFDRRRNERPTLVRVSAG